MSEVRVGDVVVQTPQFDQYVRQRTLKTNAFYNAGIIATNPTLDQHVASGLGKSLTMPFVKPLDMSVEPNMGNDDPAEFATPQDIGTGSMSSLKIVANQHWKSMDFVVGMNGRQDPIAWMGDQIGDYWGVVLSNYLNSIGVGVYENNVANDNGDMVYDNTGNGDGTMSAAAIIRARQTKGDRKRDFTAIGFHSEVYAGLEEKDLITFVKYSGQNTLFPTYNGLLVVEDDELPLVGAGNDKYLSCLYGPGAFSYGAGTPKRPLSTSYDELAGNGSGAELLHSRREFAIHPDGHDITVTPAGESPTRAEMEAATAVSRVVDRKRVNMAFIVTNG